MLAMPLAQGILAVDAAAVVRLQQPPDLAVEEMQELAIAGDLGDQGVEARIAPRL